MADCMIDWLTHCMSESVHEGISNLQKWNRVKWSAMRRQWMDEMIEWTNVRINEYMHEWMDRWMDSWIYDYDERMRWGDEWMDEWVDEWMNEWVNEIEWMSG